ncbi:hypothetical protein ACP70R_003908 [Stipagrostis hirtigluma subsp. patula]
METLAHRTEPSDAPANAASCPSWVLLDTYCHGGDDDPAALARTSAASHASTGRPFRVSFGLTPPPATSNFFFDWTGSAPDGGEDYPGEARVIAAHGGCVLVEIRVPAKKLYEGASRTFRFDYFVYDPGVARPPSLWLLPACFVPVRGDACDDGPRFFLSGHIGVLRRGEGDDEIVVAELEFPKRRSVPRRPGEDDDEEIVAAKLKLPPMSADLCVLRGHGEWELVEQVPVVVDDGDCCQEDLLWWWETDAAVPVGDRYLCFVDYIRGFLLYDTAAETSGLKLRYVPLPVEVPRGNPDKDDWGRPHMEHSRNLAAGGGGGGNDVRFVGVEPRCCCGGPGKSTCPRSSFAFLVTTWTLSLTSDEPMVAAAWVKNGVLDCGEL